MIILDTNVLSELMRAEPERAVMAWLDTQDPSNMALTAITVAEILYGIARLPDGKRKLALMEASTAIFEEDFVGRILPFDDIAAAHYAEMVFQREQIGRPIAMADAQIAAICRSVQGASLVTRNVKDFSNLGLDLLNPWLAH